MHIDVKTLNTKMQVVMQKVKSGIILNSSVLSLSSAAGFDYA